MNNSAISPRATLRRSGLLNEYGVSNFDLSGEAEETRASGGKPFEKGLSENFQLG
jgi:hypothetical protein